jgi:hypothetical protein
MHSYNQVDDAGSEKISLLRLIVLITLYTPIALLLIVSSPIHLVRILVEKLLTK